MAVDPRHRLRVMTWNVWWRFGLRWRDRQRGILTTVRAVGPDVLVLQEAWGTPAGTQLDELATHIGGHAVFAGPSLPPPPDPPEAADQAGVEIGVGVLSRWPIAWTRTVPLPARHRREATVALAAAVEHPAGLLPVITTCLEWEPQYGDDRHAQAKALADLVLDRSLDGGPPVVLAGDLNAPPDSPVLQPLRTGLTDAWLAGGGDSSAVTLSSEHPHAPVEAEELIDQRIDHVLVRCGRRGQRVEVERARTAGDQVGGLHPSDHLAVVCDLTWTG